MHALAHVDQVDSGGVNLETLETFLLSDRAPPDGMLLSDLDGFLTGIIIGPELVPPSEWLPVIWGGGTPEFIGDDEAGAVRDAILARYHEIALQIADEKCEPLFWADQDGSPIAFAWAEGFLQAIMLRVEAWEKLFKSEHVACLLPILALCSDEAGQSLLGLPPEQDEGLVQEVSDIIPECVIEIAAFWRGRSRRQIPLSPMAALTTEPTRMTIKAGRNEPCPCGSGKKFKKCCGNSA